MIAIVAVGCQSALEDDPAPVADGDRSTPSLGFVDEGGSESAVTGECPDADGNGVPDCLEECPRILTHDADPQGNPIAAGQRLEDAYSLWGVSLAVESRQDAAIAFDSSNPTGEDPDLGTPNEAFGGPGRGNGGRTTNDTALGNLVILAEDLVDADGDGFVDDPDDDARGGSLTYTFNEPMCVSGMDLIDMEGSEAVAFTLTRFDGTTVVRNGSGLGNNSIEHFELDECGIVQMDVDLHASGAIDNIEICPGGGPENCDGEDNDLDGEVDEGFPDTDGDGFADCIDRETCDGLDNDGDGDIDEDFSDTDQDGTADCVDVEECDGLDNNGDGQVDEGFGDGDSDGIADCVDVEECDGVDNNGDGVADEGFGDSDGDGIADCVDVEECDGVDNNGDGVADEGFGDSDSDGIADCVDVEECDGVDNDGDGSADEGFPDVDGDGIADCVDVEECDGVDNNGDGDADEGFPDTDEDGLADCVDRETCDGLDNDGDGQTDEGFTDTDRDGVADCVDVEECDGQDNDGDGAVDEDFSDVDGDGTADCVDTEECDGQDNDGDGEADEGFSDVDGDGIADCVDVEECDGRDNDGDGEADEGFGDSDGDGIADCADVEECDGVDNDGDGQVDEGFSDVDGDGTADCQDVEDCDGIDNNGDGIVDEGYSDTDQDGIADCVDTEECDGLDNDGNGTIDDGFSDVDNDGIADCIDTEECDGIDNNGDGIVDEGFGDSDSDGIADCLDVEECDGVDNDGDGEVDEGFGGTTYSWSRTSGFNNNGGAIQELAATYNPQTNILSFVAEIEHTNNRTTNGFTVAINNGPNPKGRGELSLLYFDASGPTPVLTAYGYNGVNGFSSYFDGSDAAGTQTPDRIASSLVDSSFLLDAWADDDGTSTSLGFIIDASVITDHMPMYVDGEPWYGIGFDDALGIWFHTKTNLSASYTNGWLNSWSYASQGWLDASNLATDSEVEECPEECPVIDGMWSYYGAVPDESAQYGGGHAFIFPNLYGDGTVRMEMAEDAQAFINPAGDLELTGTAVIYDLGGGPGVLGSEWEVTATFAYRGTGQDGEGANGPKLELLPGFQPVSVTDTWDYYDLVEAELVEQMGVGSIELQGNAIYPVQVGDTANGKNLNYGLASWFTWERFIAKIYQGTGHGDINVDLEAMDECVDDPVDPPGDPVDPPVPG